MSSSRFKGLWSILREYDFVVPSNKVNELSCILCKKILIDAMQAHCGCKYCGQCINDYLSEGPCLCPGATEECKDENLDLNYNVCNNYAINREISKLIVTCPIGNCTFEGLLINMESHASTCGKPEITCPYSLMGCDKVSHEMMEIEDHLQRKHYKHADILLKTIENLKNDIETVTCENKRLKEQLERKQLSIEKLEEKMSELAESLEQWEQEQKKANSLPNELQIINAKVEKKTDLKLYGELIWKINHFSSLKSLKSIDSEPFLTHFNGYRIQIRMFSNVMISGVSGMTFYPNCVRGDNDEHLVWPVNCKATFGIINPSTGQCECEQSHYIVYYWPIKSQVRPFNLKHYWSFVSNDCLTIKCTVEIV